MEHAFQHFGEHSASSSLAIHIPTYNQSLFFKYTLIELLCSVSAAIATSYVPVG
jgi:hypothetical protein